MSIVTIGVIIGGVLILKLICDLVILSCSNEALHKIASNLESIPSLSIGPDECCTELEVLFLERGNTEGVMLVQAVRKQLHIRRKRKKRGEPGTSQVESVS